MAIRKKNKFDKTEIGFLSGGLLPVFIFFAVYLFNNNEISLADYTSNLWQLNALAKLGSLCVFANVLVFWGFLKLKYERAARGVLGATIIYAFVVLLSKAF